MAFSVIGILKSLKFFWDKYKVQNLTKYGEYKLQFFEECEDG